MSNNQNTAKVYKKSDSEFILNFPEDGKQFRLTSNGIIQKSKFSPEQLETYPLGSWDSDVRAALDNALSVLRSQVSLQEAEGLSLVVQEKTEDFDNDSQ